MQLGCQNPTCAVGISRNKLYEKKKKKGKRRGEGGNAGGGGRVSDTFFEKGFTVKIAQDLGAICDAGVTVIYPRAHSNGSSMTECSA